MPLQQQNQSLSHKIGTLAYRVLTTLVLFFSFHTPTLYANPEPLPVPTIISASEADYPPFCTLNMKNQADGFSVELLRAVLKIMGRDVSFTVGPWTEVKQSLIDRKVQVLPLVGRTPEREAVFDFTFPYMTMHGAIFVRSETDNIHSLADLSGKRVAVMSGDNAEEFLLRKNIGISIIGTESFDIALENLSRGDSDAVVIQKLLATQLINKLNISNLKSVGPPLDEFAQSFCFAVPKGDAHLLSFLNEGLSLVIANGTFEALRKKWFANLEAPPKSRIIVGGDYDYPPYEFLDKNGQPTGYNVDLTRAIAASLGLSVHIQLGPWRAIRKKLDDNQIDLIQGMFYSTERDKSLAFTNAHTFVSHVIISRTNTKKANNFDDLSGKIIAIMEGDIMHDMAVDAGFAKQIILVETQQEALRLLVDKDVDYAMLAKIPALYWIEKNELKNLQVGDSSLVSSEYCYASTHANRNLIERFSQGLDDLKASGEYRAIHQKWLGTYEEQGLNPKIISKYAMFIFTPFLVLLVFSVIWTKTLKRKVHSRTKELVTQISERKLIEEKLAQKAEKLKASQSMLIQQEKLAAIGQLAAGIAHEINNPLGYISSNLHTLQKYTEKINGYFLAQMETGTTLPSDQWEQIQTIKKKFKIDPLLEDLPDLISDSFDGIERIKKIVQGMKSFSRKDSDTPAPVDLNECLENAITIVWNEIKYNSELERDLSDLPHINGFQQQLAQVFMNLLVNASHAIKEKGLIRIKNWCEENKLIVTVADNGSGISEENLEKIFDPFFTTKEPGKGTGLGMSIAREIIHKHGGTISVQSEMGKGTTFTVTLPLTEGT